MPRRRRAEIREIQPDGVYNSTLAEKFINSMMWDGKKTTSQKIFYSAMDTMKERTSDDPLKLFKKAIENCMRALRDWGTYYDIEGHTFTLNVLDGNGWDTVKWGHDGFRGKNPGDEKYTKLDLPIEVVERVYTSKKTRKRR